MDKERFIQGPSLHDETISYAGSEATKSTGTLNGDEASQAYVEILSLPSTAVHEEPSSSSSSSINTFEANKQEKVPSVPRSKPKLSKLMSICESNDYEKLEKYLQDFETDIDIDSTDEFGWTMLMSASCAGATECVSILLQCGADWTIMDRKGMTALCIARKNNKSTCCQLLQEWFQCYIEYQRRVTTDNSDQPDSSINTSEGETSASTEYCESCKFNFSSSRDLHEKSIAHLVSTAQFGNDTVHFGIPESNKGFQLLLKGGWDKSSGLGPDGTGHKFPVKTILKRDKLGLGNEKEKKAARITHFGPFDSAAVEGPSTRVEREVVTRRREAAKQRNKERLKEIDFRREFSAL
ncbi:unnamed protein product [Orchesella dallaii]|uniref:G-patch domain-containing protein n=1 Tax=Orchesella dallaii TaxID=48710 RepID=A0ABP1PZ03_9HEXA